MATKWWVERAVYRDDRGDRSRAWIRDLPTLRPNERLLMGALLCRAEADTATVGPDHSPSLTELADMTGLDRSTVRRILTRLETEGWVVRNRPDPVDARMRGVKTWYRLTIPGHDVAPVAATPEAEPAGGTLPLAGGDTPPPVEADSPQGRGHQPLIPVLTPEQPEKTTAQAPPAKPKAKPKARARPSAGIRLPDNWAPDNELKQWTLDQGMKQEQARQTLEDFSEYWHAKTGKDATKAGLNGWGLTWRRWVRKELADAKQRGTRRPVSRMDRTTQILDAAEARLNGQPVQSQFFPYVMGETA